MKLDQNVQGEKITIVNGKAWTPSMFFNALADRIEDPNIYFEMSLYSYCAVPTAYRMFGIEREFNTDGWTTLVEVSGLSKGEWLSIYTSVHWKRSDAVSYFRSKALEVSQ